MPHPHSNTRLPRLLAALCILVLLCAPGCSGVGQGNRSTLKILHINDVHSFLEPETIDLVLDRTPIACEAGGMARVAALVDDLAGGNENHLVLHAGDAVQGALYFTLFDGRTDAEVMNAMGLDAMAIGNHEFDEGNSWLAGFIDRLDVPVVSANIEVGPADALAGRFTPYIVREFDGTPMGIIGLTVGEVTRRSSRPDAATRFLDEAAAVQEAVDELTARGVGRIVVLSHFGHENDLALAGKLTDVDVIVGGHSHTLLGDFDDIGLHSDGAYPAVTRNADGEPVCVVQAWAHGHVLGELDVTFQGDVLVSWHGTPHLTLGTRFTPKDGGENAGPLTGDALSRVLAAVEAAPTLDIPAENAAVAGIISKYNKKIDSYKKSVIGTAGEGLPHIRVPGTAHDGTPLPLGSRIAPVVARAFYERDPRADICIQNAGGVRTGIRAGEISFATAYEMLPFSNTLFEIEITGAQIHRVLEDALDYLARTGTTGAFPYAYGLKYDVDATAACGSRISGLEVKDRATGVYSPLSESARYVVVTSDYLAEGRDGYDTFAGIVKQEGGADTYIDYAQAFVSYVKELTAAGRPLTALPAEDHCIKRFIPTGEKNDGM